MKEAPFFVLPPGVEAALEKLIVQGEVHAGQDHEYGDHPIHVGAVVCSDAGVFGGESAGGHGGEGVAGGIEKIHPAQHQKYHLQGGYGRVHPPKHAGRVHDARLQAVRGGAGHLGLVKLHAPHAQKGQNGHAEHDKSHAAQPVGQSPPEEHPVAGRLHVGQNAGPGGGEAADRLEYRVGESLEIPGEIMGQSAPKALPPPRPGPRWPCPGGDSIPWPSCRGTARRGWPL